MNGGRTANGRSTRRASTGRARRRLAVATMYLCMVAIVGMIAFEGESWWLLLGYFVLLALAIAIQTRVVGPIARDVTGRRAPELDERQLAVRDRAHHHAYHILGGLLLLTVAYATLSSGLGLPIPGTYLEGSALVVLVTFVYPSLPAAVVAWIGPDPLPEEED